MAASTSSESSLMNPSLKPWFLTYYCEELFVWKNGRRMQLKDGTSSGPVSTVSCNTEEKVITLRGPGDQHKKYAFHCLLEKFNAAANDFCRKLADDINDCSKFCEHLCSMTNGAVQMDSSTCQPSLLPQKRCIDGETVTAKKRKSGHLEEANRLKEEIPGHHIGTFTIPVSLLKMPPPYLCVREVKEWYVQYLMSMLVHEENDHEDKTAPLLVLASATKADFDEKKMKKYTYEVIGGVQRYVAIMKINTGSGRKILERKCAVYGRGLTRPAALVLARQHNEYNQIQRASSFPEIAACCRRLLFAHFSNGEDDDGETDLVVPRYNTQIYRSFKQECLTFLLTPMTSQAMIEQAIQMASQKSSIYHKMQAVFSKYEEGSLKGQKKKVLKGTALTRAIEGKYAAKLPQFKIFQGLDDDVKEKILNDLYDGSISYAEAETKAQKEKSAVKLLQKRAKLAKDVPAGGTDDVVVVAKSDLMTIAVIAPTSLYQSTEIAETDLLLLSIKDVCSTDELVEVLDLISKHVKNCTMVMRRVKLQHVDVEAVLTSFGAHGRAFLLSSVSRSDTCDVLIGTSETIFLAWWGPKSPPASHLLQNEQVNSIVAQDNGSNWLSLLLLNPKPTHVTDLYTSGELTQLCQDRQIRCLSLHSSMESATSVATKLEIEVGYDQEGTMEVAQDSPESSSDQKGQAKGSKNKETGTKKKVVKNNGRKLRSRRHKDTQELVDELSEAEKTLNDIIEKSPVT